jgi:hypothetical protein
MSSPFSFSKQSRDHSTQSRDREGAVTGFEFEGMCLANMTGVVRLWRIKAGGHGDLSARGGWFQIPL